MNKLIIGSVIRHILTVVATVLAAKGINVDEGTIGSVTDIILGLILGGGVLAHSSMEKKNTTVDVKRWFLSDRSIKNMEGIKPELVQLINLALVESPYDFVIIDGLRTVDEQRVLVNAKKSQTMSSKHLTGDAFDFMAYDETNTGTWDYKYYKAITDSMKSIVARENLDITFGIDWKGFVDSGHVQVGK